MLAIIINTITAPGETLETVVSHFSWKKALIPISLLMAMAMGAGFLLSDQIADIQWEQIETSINNSNIPLEQKEEILSNQYERVYSSSGASAIFTYMSMAISWPIRILFWALFTMIVCNLFLGGGGSYNQIFTLSAFAYLPSAVEYIIKTPIQYLSDNLLIYTGLGILGIGEQGEFLNSFLTGIDLFAFWRVFLMALGISIIYNKSTKTSLFTITALWIFGLAIFAGMGSFFASFSG